MKEKILLFIIGVLVGAVISTGAFYVYTIANNSSNCNNMQTNGGTPPQMQNGQNNENGQPPEKPNETNTQNNSNTQQNTN